MTVKAKPVAGKSPERGAKVKHYLRRPRHLSPAGMSGIALGTVAGAAIGGPVGAFVGAAVGAAAGEALERVAPSEAQGRAQRA